MQPNEAPKYLYIHWPFCKNKCHYCDFVSFEKHEGFEKQYHDALCNEIKTYSKTLRGEKKIKTIFFGGGTPSMYPLEILEELFSVLRKNFDLTEVKEVTLEVNPGGITDELLSTWRRLGINRLSVGVQVLDDKVLSNLNRNQTVADVEELMDSVPKYFDNVSVDLILGLPGVTEDLWKNTLKTVALWPIRHISIYMLMVYEKTPLYFRMQKGELEELDNDLSADLYMQTVKFLGKSGFLQYEISNFAYPGFESLHNKAYWDHVPYQGFGLGAASFDGAKRMMNHNNLLRYLELHSSEGGLEYGFEEALSEQQLLVERLMLGLRQTKGQDLHSMLYLFKRGERKGVMLRLNALREQSLVDLRDNRIVLTIKGMALENEVILSLIRS